MILISLGSIVKCQTPNSVREFQKIIDRLGFQYQAASLLPQLTNYIEQFNRGDIIQEQFISFILSLIINKAKELNPNIPTNLSSQEKQELNEQLLTAWNSQVEIDSEAIILMKKIKELKENGKEIVIYSGTNFSHLNYQLNIFNRYELELSEQDIHATYIYKRNKAPLAQHLIDTYKKANPSNPCIIVMSDSKEYNDYLECIKVDNGALKYLEESKRKEVTLLAAEHKNVYVREILGNRLTLEDLDKLLAEEADLKINRSPRSRLTPRI